MKRWDEFHNTTLPLLTKTGRVRRLTPRKSFFERPSVVLAVLVACFAVAGTIEYADIERAELAAAKAQVKTARADQ